MMIPRVSQSTMRWRYLLISVTKACSGYVTALDGSESVCLEVFVLQSNRDSSPHGLDGAVFRGAIGFNICILTNRLIVSYCQVRRASHYTLDTFSKRPYQSYCIP